MVRVNYKNLERSEMANKVIEDGVASLEAKFPDLSQSIVKVSLQMDNSQFKAGTDLFQVRLRLDGGRYHGIFMKKSGPDLYRVIHELMDLFQNKMNDKGDARRVKNRKQSREFLQNTYKSVS